MTSEGDKMIEVVELTKIFGDLRAVDRVTLAIEQGEIFGLVGPDGAGKTTLLRMLCGIISPTSGRVTLVETAKGNNQRARAVFGYMPQKFSLYGDLTVLENIEFYGALFKLDRQTVRQRAGEILELTDLSSFKSRFADNLSGGMKQKLALTCALVARPEMLILDEPTYGVDPEYRKEFWRILYRLNKEGMTIIVSTPYMDEAELCKRVALMDRGAIVSLDTPVNLKKNFPYRILEVRAESRDMDFLGDLPEAVDAGFFGDRYHVVVKDPEPARAAIAAGLAQRRINLLHMEEIPPTMEDVFVSLTGKEVV